MRLVSSFCSIPSSFESVFPAPTSCLSECVSTPTLTPPGRSCKDVRLYPGQLQMWASEVFSQSLVCCIPADTSAMSSECSCGVSRSFCLSFFLSGNFLSSHLPHPPFQDILCFPVVRNPDVIRKIGIPSYLLWSYKLIYSNLWRGLKGNSN